MVPRLCPATACSCGGGRRDALHEPGILGARHGLRRQLGDLALTPAVMRALEADDAVESAPSGRHEQLLDGCYVLRNQALPPFPALRRRDDAHLQRVPGRSVRGDMSTVQGGRASAAARQDKLLGAQAMPA